MIQRPLTVLLAIALAVTTMTTNAQQTGYTFTDEITIEVTPVRDQYRSGTCWSYAAISFLEAELIREKKGEYDLSEMFLVRNCFTEKADKYVRMHGKTNFGGGGLAHDLVMVWNKYGLVPEEAYDGMTIGEERPVHGEMEAVLTGYVEQVIKNPNRKLTPVWKKGFEGVLDAYLGAYPVEF
ncbi:MAG: C1 family peptidase [Bacteroidales bacterium]|nr:C1 family peptidase [Bacteroidales bacterium]